MTHNVIPELVDARNPQAWLGDALFQPQSRQAFRRLENLGFTDAIRASTDESGVYSFWDYQAGAWQKNNGIRIDHLMLSPEATNRFISANIEKHVRAWEKPSDQCAGNSHVGGLERFRFNRKRQRHQIETSGCFQ